MDWRIFPSAYGHIYKKLIMEQPIIITPPVGTINQNECLSFCSKKVFWRPVWFKLFCTSAEPAVTLLSVWRCRNLASFYLPLTPRNPRVRKLFICIRKKQFAFWAVTLTIGNFFLFLCFQLKMKKKSRQVYWLTRLFIIRIGVWIFRFLRVGWQVLTSTCVIRLNSGQRAFAMNKHVANSSWMLLVWFYYKSIAHREIWLKLFPHFQTL